MNRNLSTYLIIAALGLYAACSWPITRNAVQSFDVQTSKLDPSAAFNKVTGILVDRGFDIKSSNKDAGVIATEYKKFASVGERPPFDYYLQIKVTLRTAPNGETIVRLAPIVKESNRLNAAAFTESELTYFTGDESNLRMVSSQQTGGWRATGQTLFMNVVQDVAEVAGLTVEQTKQNITTTPADAMSERN